MLPLLLTLAAMATAPLLDKASRRHPGAESALDGLVVVVVLGVVLLLVLPHGLQAAGWIALPAMLLGSVGAWALHRLPWLNAGWGWLAVVAVLLHGLADGAALAAPDDHGHPLSAAVVLHALPVGLAIWRAARRVAGYRAAAALLGVTGVVTALGFGFAAPVLAVSQGPEGALALCLLAGGLLHVVGHLHGPGVRRCEGLGALLGVAVVGWLTTHHPGPGPQAPELGSAEAFLALTFEAGPALLLGFVAAGALHVLAPGSLARWLSGRSRAGEALRGAMVGLPAPVCSCGALPVYEGLLARGAPPAASLAFLVAGPEIGAATLLVSLPLLGGPITALRVVAALTVAIGVALWVADGRGHAAPPAVAGPALPLSARLREAWRFGFVETFDHVAPWVLTGLGVAALVEPLLSVDGLTRVPAPLAVLGAAVVGVPLYVCASGATPLVAVLMHKGLSTGAALAFLLTGPATNITTFGVLRRLHGRRVALRFGTAVAGGSVLLGWGVDALLPPLAPPALHGAALHAHGPLEQLSVALLGALLVASLLRGGTRGFLEALLRPLDHEGHDHEHGGHAEHAHAERSGGLGDDPREHHHGHGHSHEHGHSHDSGQRP